MFLYIFKVKEYNNKCKVKKIKTGEKVSKTQKEVIMYKIKNMITNKIIFTDDLDEFIEEDNFSNSLDNIIDECYLPVIVLTFEVYQSEILKKLYPVDYEILLDDCIEILREQIEDFVEQDGYYEILDNSNTVYRIEKVEED